MISGSFWWIWLVVVAIVIILMIWFFLRTRKPIRGALPAEKVYIQALEAIIDGDDENSKQLLQEAIRLNTDNVPAYLHLADIYRDNDDFVRSLNIHRVLLVRELPDEERINLAIRAAEDLLMLKRYSQAAAFIQTETSKYKKASELYELLAEANLEQGLYDQALEADLKAAKLNEQSKSELKKITAWYHYLKAEKELKENRNKAAIDLLKSVLNDDAECLPAILLLGDQYYKAGERDKAVAQWQDVLKRFKEYSSVVIPRLEQAHYESGDYQSMEYLYTKHLAEFPDNKQVRWALAQILIRKGEYETALNTLQGSKDKDKCFNLQELQLLTQLDREEELLKKIASWLEEISPTFEDVDVCDCCPDVDYAFFCVLCERWLLPERIKSPLKVFETISSER